MLVSRCFYEEVFVIDSFLTFFQRPTVSDVIVNNTSRFVKATPVIKRMTELLAAPKKTAQKRKLFETTDEEDHEDNFLQNWKLETMSRAYKKQQKAMERRKRLLSTIVETEDEQQIEIEEEDTCVNSSDEDELMPPPPPPPKKSRKVRLQQPLPPITPPVQQYQLEPKKKKKLPAVKHQLTKIDVHPNHNTVKRIKPQKFIAPPPPPPPPPPSTIVKRETVKRKMSSKLPIQTYTKQTTKKVGKIPVTNFILKSAKEVIVKIPFPGEDDDNEEVEVSSSGSDSEDDIIEQANLNKKMVNSLFLFYIFYN